MAHHGSEAPGGRYHPNQHGHAAGPDTVRDPVCGMTVDPAKTAHHAEHAGHAYHFCSAGCRTRFIAEPGQFLEARATLRAEAVTPGTIHTCPMHPQIRQPGPGRWCRQSAPPRGSGRTGTPGAKLGGAKAAVAVRDCDQPRQPLQAGPPRTLLRQPDLRRLPRARLRHRLPRPLRAKRRGLQPGGAAGGRLRSGVMAWITTRRWQP